jgi:hypothetical protein
VYLQTIQEIRVDRRFWQRASLAAAALFAVVLAVLRASTQAITVDEATTYFWFASGSEYSPWWRSSNNHVLNSILMWVSTHAFGLSPLTVRLPALLGAIVYVSVCVFLCRRLLDRFSLQLPVFVCLVYNPYILDFMAAARGYSLANAFLLAAIAAAVSHHRAGSPTLLKSCILASLALGLSFAANFSFAFVDFATFLALTAWAWKRKREISPARVLMACALPGTLLALVICGYPATHMAREELWYGAHSLTEMSRGLIEASLHQLDPRFEHSGWYKAVSSMQPFLLPALAVLCIWQFLASRSRWLGWLSGTLAAVVTLTIVLHWIAFRFAGLPLPKGRTAIFLLPLCTLLAAALAASVARSRWSLWSGRACTVAWCGLAAYFLLCLRISYFEEYQWDADAKDVYNVLAGLNHTYGIKEAAARDMYHAPLNLYRTMSKQESFSEFTLVIDTPPPGKPVYILLYPHDLSFIESENLRVIYHGSATDVVVAIRPGDLTAMHSEGLH